MSKLAKKVSTMLTSSSATMDQQTTGDACKKDAFPGLEHLIERITHLEATCKEQASTIKKMTSPVAFTAGYTSGPNENIQITNTVIYNEEIYNVGGGYNPATGKFICPIAGLYSFTVNVLAGMEGNTFKGACVAIRHNGKEIVRAGAYDPDFRAEASNNLILTLKKGDSVYVTVSGGTPAWFWTCPGPFNTFTGVLLSVE